MNKVIVSLLALAAIAFGVMEMNGTGDLQARFDQLSSELAKAQQDSARLARDLDAAREDIARLGKEKEALENQLKEMRGNVEKNAGITSALAGTENKKPANDGRADMAVFARGFLKSLDDPDVRKAMKSGQEQMINMAYGALFKKLGLDEATSKLAADLLGDRNMDALAKARKLAEGGATDETRSAIRKDIETVKADYDTKLKSVLGEDKFQELNTFEKTVGDQRALDGLSRTFDRKGVALPPEQKDTLSNIMREERLKNPTNEIPDLGGGPGMSLLMSEAEATDRQKQEDAYATRVVDRASQSGFSPDQVTILQDSFKQRSQRQTQQRVFGRLLIGAGR